MRRTRNASSSSSWAWRAAPSTALQKRSPVLNENWPHSAPGPPQMGTSIPKHEQFHRRPAAAAKDFDALRAKLPKAGRCCLPLPPRRRFASPPPPARAASFDAEVGFGSAQVEGALAHGLWVCSDLIQSALKG